MLVDAQGVRREGEGVNGQISGTSGTVGDWGQGLGLGNDGASQSGDGGEELHGGRSWIGEGVRELGEGWTKNRTMEKEKTFLLEFSILFIFENDSIPPPALVHKCGESESSSLTIVQRCIGDWLSLVS